jgi:hypothetical protein
MRLSGSEVRLIGHLYPQTQMRGHAEIGLAYMLLVGSPLCFVAMCGGVMLIAMGLLMLLTIAFAPFGVAASGAGMTLMVVGARYVTLPHRHWV